MLVQSKIEFPQFSEFSCIILSFPYERKKMQRIFKIQKGKMFPTCFLFFLNSKTNFGLNLINGWDHWGPNASLDTKISKLDWFCWSWFKEALGPSLKPVDMIWANNFFKWNNWKVYLKHFSLIFFENLLYCLRLREKLKMMQANLLVCLRVSLMSMLRMPSFLWNFCFCFAFFLLLRP